MSDTPILDREQPLPMVKKRFKAWHGLLLGAVIGVLLAGSTNVLPDPPASSGLVFVFGFAAIYFGVLVHELGHLLAGLSVGFDPRVFAVGQLYLRREERRWKLQFIPTRFGGLTGMVPKSSDRLVDRFLRFALGGPVATFVLLVIASILVLVFPGSLALRTLLFVDLYLVAMCCIPFTVRGSSTDAKNILLLRRKGAGAEHFAAILYILALDTQQVEPHDWPPELVDKLNLPIEDKAHLGTSIALLSNVAADSGDTEWLAREIERGLAVNHESRPDLQRAFQVSAACFQGIFRHNALLAQAWLDSARHVKSTASRKDWDAKPLASIAMAKGESARAQELLTRHLTSLDRLPRSGMIAAERRRIVDLLHGIAV